MSANAGDGAGGGGERPGGFSRFMRRASSVLRRDRTKRQSVSGNPALVSPRDDPATTRYIQWLSIYTPNRALIFHSTPAEAQPATQESAIEEPAMEEPAIQEPTTQKPAIQQPATQEPTTMAPAVGAVAPPLPSKDKAEDRKSEAMPSKPQSATTAAENNKIQEEKARALFAKYNMTLEIGEWTPPFKADAVRVERKVRIRIHRHCHRCQTVFGLEKQCTECGHTRCKKCPRTNMRNRQERKGKSVVTGGIVVDDKYVSMMGPDVLNMPYRRTGKELSDAASRICHKCQTTFAGNALQCGACGHQRCAQCPQDP